MSSDDLTKGRESARALMSSIFSNFYERREAVKEIGKKKITLKMNVEDYLQEFKLINEFKAFMGNEGRLFSILIQDSLEAQGLSPMQRLYDDAEMEGIVSFNSDGLEDSYELEKYVRNNIMGTEGLGVGFVNGRKLAIFSWLVEFGYGRATNIVEPMPRSMDQIFWVAGSRPYRFSTLHQALNNLKHGTVIIKAPNVFGKIDDLSALSDYENAPVLLDITYLELKTNGNDFRFPTINSKSVMIYGIPGTVGQPWETVAVIGKPETVDKIEERFYSLLGSKFRSFPAPDRNISKAIGMIKRRIKELNDLTNQSFVLPEFGPFVAIKWPQNNVPEWAIGVDASFYGNYSGLRVINLLKRNNG